MLPSIPDIERNNIFDGFMWEEMLAVQRGNIDCCVVDKKTQLLSRTMKIALMNHKSCVNFSENNNNLLIRGDQDSIIWQDCLYKACEEFIVSWIIRWFHWRIFQTLSKILLIRSQIMWLCYFMNQNKYSCIILLVGLLMLWKNSHSRRKMILLLHCYTLLTFAVSEKLMMIYQRKLFCKKKCIWWNNFCDSRIFYFDPSFGTSFLQNPVGRRENSSS